MTEPNSAACLPATQSVQAELAEDAEYLPGSHAAQAFHPTSEYCPAAHEVQTPASICSPGMQHFGVNLEIIVVLSVA
jgi:hypothetical protein